MRAPLSDCFEPLRKGLKKTQSFCTRGMAKLGLICGRPKVVDNYQQTLDKLNETVGILEGKERQLQEKAAAEFEKAVQFIKAKNKRGAINCLKRKRLYEPQIELLGNFQLQIQEQIIKLEGAKVITETVDALQTGAAAMKAMQKASNIDYVHKTMDEISEQMVNINQIEEALSAPIGASADFDEDEMEAELEELEEEHLNPATTAPTAPVTVPAGGRPNRPVAQPTAEEGGLADLQADMEL